MVFWTAFDPNFSCRAWMDNTRFSSCERENNFQVPCTQCTWKMRAYTHIDVYMTCACWHASGIKVYGRIMGLQFNWATPPTMQKIWHIVHVNGPCLSSYQYLHSIFLNLYCQTYILIFSALVCPVHPPCAFCRGWLCLQGSATQWQGSSFKGSFSVFVAYLSNLQSSVNFVKVFSIKDHRVLFPFVLCKAF